MSELHRAECTSYKSDSQRNKSLKAEQMEEVYIGMRTCVKQTGSGVFYLSLDIFISKLNQKKRCRFDF